MHENTLTLMVSICWKEEEEDPVSLSYHYAQQHIYCSTYMPWQFCLSVRLSQM